VREALAEVVADTSPTANVLQADNLASTLMLLEETEQIDLVILDLNLPDAYGFLSLLEVRYKAPNANILVLSAYAEPRAMQLSYLLGANGFLTKASGTQEILYAINHMANGSRKPAKKNKAQSSLPDGVNFRQSCEEQLTFREMRVLRMVCKGLMNKMVAYEMGVSESTIKTHVGEILRKFGLSNRTQVVLEVLYPVETVEQAPMKCFP
jgi:DNA-binding NarL/FixJ family response regulator